MRFGVTMFVTDQTIGPVELARAAEERGFSSLYLPEHTHIPVSRRTPPPTGGDVLDPSYARTLDPWVALSAAAAVTETLQVGTGVALAAQHDPIVLAKQVATLDHLSGGRAVLGVGFGWNREEMEDHGVRFETRRAMVREHVLAMQALWADDEAAFDGDFVSFEPTWSWPKPVRRRVPVLIGGGAGPKLFDHVVEYADGWIPIGGAGLGEALPELRERWIAAGRQADALQVIPFGTLPTPGKLDHYRSLGITEVVLRVPSAGRGEAFQALDGLADVVRRV
ncbi:MAG: LLM class F420-dependent oxidoreductase [Acidimicrobiales bacterium]